MANNDANAVAAVAVKLPEFWQSKPRAWFHTVEAQFAIRNITADATRYHYVIAALGSDTASNVEALLDDPPANDKYEALKTRLLSIYDLSERQKKRLLINLDGLGDRKPTELLRYMQSLHRAENNDALFMAFFMNQLPRSVRRVLSAQDFDDVEKLAKAADNVVEEDGVYATPQPIQATRSPRLPPTANTAAATNQDNVCWYHRKFGSAAKSCRPPCSASAQGNASASH